MFMENEGGGGRILSGWTRRRADLFLPSSHDQRTAGKSERTRSRRSSSSGATNSECIGRCIRMHVAHVRRRDTGMSWWGGTLKLGPIAPKPSWASSLSPDAMRRPSILSQDNVQPPLRSVSRPRDRQWALRETVGSDAHVRNTITAIGRLLVLASADGTLCASLLGMGGGCLQARWCLGRPICICSSDEGPAQSMNLCPGCQSWQVSTTRLLQTLQTLQSELQREGRTLDSDPGSDWAACPQAVVVCKQP
jgi:hypothetical protein